MKIGISLLTVELDRLGGLNIRLAALVRGLAKAGHEVVTIQREEILRASSDFYANLTGRPVKRIGVPFQLGPSPLCYLRLPALWCLAVDEIVRRERLDVLDLWDPLFRVPQSRSYRVVFSHNHYSPYLWEHLHWCGMRTMPMLLEIPFLRAMLKWRERGIDGYVVETEAQRRWLLKETDLPEHRVVVIPPGFDPALLRSARQSCTSGAASPPVVVFSGRLHRWKGVFELIEAFSILSRNFAQWRLHFVGDGPARPGLEQAVRDKQLHERVVFWGNRSYAEALAIVAKAEVIVLPSYIESFSLSLLEGMALGLAAISTDTGAAKEYLIEDGVSGLLVRRKDAEAIYQALVRLVADPDLRASVGRRGQERAKRFTFDCMVESTAQFYARIAAG